MLSEPLLIAIYIYIFGYLFFLKHTYHPSKRAMWIFGVLCVFAAYVITCTAIRIHNGQPYSAVIWPSRVILLTPAIFFLFENGKISFNKVLQNTVSAAAVIALIEIIYCVISNDFRKFPFMSNTHLSLLSLGLAPMSMYALKIREEKNLSWLITPLAWFQLGITALVSLLSGWRIATFLFLVMFVIGCYFFLGKKLYKQIIIFIICCSIAMATLISTNYLQARTNASRVVIGLSANDKTGANPKTSLDRSNLVRSSFWKSAISCIKSSPVIGVGYLTVANRVAEDGIIHPQSAHNFILEVGMCYGILGLMIFLSIYAPIVCKTLFSRDTINNDFRILLLLSLMMVLGIAFMQPFLLSYPPLLVIWNSIGISAVFGSSSISNNV